MITKKQRKTINYQYTEIAKSILSESKASNKHQNAKRNVQIKKELIEKFTGDIPYYGLSFKSLIKN